MKKDTRRLKVKTLPPGNKEEEERLFLATPENYERVIWDSIYTYNFSAQLDIAELLYENFKDLSTRLPEGHPFLQNLILRAIQLYLEVADQFGLVCMAILDKHQRPVFETYIESDNVSTRKFFNLCAEGKITDTLIEKIWGLDKLKNAKIDPERQKQLKMVIDETIKSEKKNLEQFGKTYSAHDIDSGRTTYTSVVKGSFAIKHGFKMLHISDLAKKMWQLEDNNPTVMQEIKNVEVRGRAGVIPVITVGSVFDSKTETIDEAFQNLIKLIKFLSSEIGTIAEIQFHLMDNPLFIVGVLTKAGKIKFERNEKCFCGSNKKYKKCHGLLV